MNMETKIKNLLSAGNVIISKVDTNVIDSFIKVYEDCKCPDGCDPIDGWMLKFCINKKALIKSILNELCVKCEEMGLEYDLACNFGKNNTKISLWIVNNVIERSSRARRVFRWDDKSVQISNASYNVELNNN